MYLMTMDQTVENRVPVIEMAVIRDPFWNCDEVLSLKNDEFTFMQNGTLLIHSSEEYLNNYQYCLYPKFYTDFPKYIWVVVHRCMTILLPGTLEVSVISLICFILTIAVYLYVEKLRNVIGKCLISCIFGRFMETLNMILDDLSVLNGICSSAGYSLYFFKLASSLWHTVISYHVWKGFKSIIRNEPRHQFLTYSVFVWGTALIPTGIIYLINQSWNNDLHKWNWMPLVGFSQCSVKDSNSSSWIYYFGPLQILSTFNAAMFTSTAIHIRKVRRQLMNFRQEKTASSLHFNSQTYLEFLRLSVLMGVSWTLDFVPFFAHSANFWWPVVWALKYYQKGFGIIIFILLILKRSTIVLIINSFRENR
ncbi:probable G-protein coupled receptor Mth-like 7 [Drosophila gunungcola]|uniref:probable G-protein coupled receptor Mth-like 7 n=1 Tax=Drosophila gunungcola TaxID=103775 RepID=UPI0022E8546D|nr:probable G-protein coupled receptor Mth-like 7 [Drosophila gunungcola]